MELPPVNPDDYLFPEQWDLQLMKALDAWEKWQDGVDVS